MTAEWESPWTVEELATVCQVSPSLIRKAIKVGSLQVHRFGRVVRIAAPEARRFAAELGASLVSSAHQAHDAHETHQAHPVKLTLARR